MLRSFTRSALAATALATLPHAPAFAQAYPSRPVSIVLPLAAGTGLDVIARSYAEKLAQSLGRPVIVDNKPGGSQVVAINALLNAPADGHTLVVLTSGALSINPTVFKKLPYDAQKDFVPISLYLKSPFILVVNPALPIRSVPELIAYAKENKGKMSYSSAGISSAPHLAGEMLNLRFGLDLTNVPYKNSPQSIADVASGVVQMAFAEAGASQSLIKEGRIRALAVSSLTRLNTLPDVPPFAEVSGANDFEAVSWHVLVARAGTPREIVARLHDEMKRIMKEPDIQQRLTNIGLIPVDSPSIEGIQRYVQSESDKWGGLVKKLGLEGSQ
jgi:tripartite-type tricarboxylate transporter receptor subunit TctC